jgi:hypothetical protein
MQGRKTAKGSKNRFENKSHHHQVLPSFFMTGLVVTGLIIFRPRWFQIPFPFELQDSIRRIWCSGHLKVLFAGLWGEVSPSGQGFSSAFDSAMRSRGLKAATRRFLGGGGGSGGGGEGGDDDEDEAFGYFGEEDEVGKGFYDDEF